MNNESADENAAVPTHSVNYKDILSQLGPIEKLLGSVSYSDTDGAEGKTQQLRTSARVFKKMKFDQSHQPPPEKKDKKEEVKPEDVKHEKKAASPLWTSEEKKMFFDALNEYGKDFESIHLYLSSRMKKKGIPEDLIKNKHQIRHFYYKTFHMLMGYLKFSEFVPKNVQELYALINYGEIRRKIGSVTKKNWSKLNELIYNGSIALRIKGKTIRIKTPMCRALRRLNQLDEKYDDLKLPTRVLVELKPKNMESFLKVQSMAQNPRLRMALSLQKRLSSLITCVSVRWKTTEAIIYDKALVSTNVSTKDCVPSQKTIEQNSLLLTPLMRLTPPVDAHIDLPTIDISEYFTGQSICLTAFETRKGVKSKPTVTDDIKKEEPAENKTGISPVKASDEDTESSKEELKSSVDQTLDQAVSTILCLQTHQEDQTKGKSDASVSEAMEVVDIKVEENREKIRLIKEGWTLENCECLTIGEIYLMFGGDSKIMLEYSWDDLTQTKKESDQTDAIVSNALQKLASLAKLHSTKTAVKCNCGHVCGVNPKSNVQFKKPAAPPKVMKKSQGSQENAPAETDPIKTALPDDQTLHDSNNQMAQIINQIDTMQRLNPKFGSKRRPISKQVVVERNLVPNKSEKNHHIVSMNIISTQQESKPVESASSASSSLKFTSEDIKESVVTEPLLGSNAAVMESLLPKNNNNVVVDAVVKGEPGGSENFSGLLCSSQPSNSDLSAGISKILKENEHQWLTTDVADYSLSSLLGHLDSKTNQSCPSMSNDDVQLPQDVDAQLRTLLIETSVDYTAKFADLAAQVVDNKK